MTLPRTVIADPLRDPLWTQLVEHSPEALPFHHPLWLRLVGSSFRYPVAAVVVLDDGLPVAGLPVAAVASRLTGRRLVALPFTDACGPVAVPGAAPRALEALAEALDALRLRRGVRLEIRAPFGRGTARVHHCQHVLDLAPGPEALERGFASQTRRNVRRARREGVEVERRTDDAALDTFFRLHVQTRRKLGVPTQPRRFIAGLKDLFDAGLGFVSIARFGERPVAAAVFLRAGGTVVYKYGASDEEMLRVRPNHAVFADVIAWACEAGLRELSFGRTDLDGEGLRAFKTSWGARELPLPYTYAGGAPADTGGAKGDVLAQAIRRSPPVVGRVIGRALYRHVG